MNKIIGDGRASDWVLLGKSTKPAVDPTKPDTERIAALEAALWRQLELNRHALRIIRRLEQRVNQLQKNQYEHQST